MQSGTQLGSYEILSPLGKGGMGEVWRARDQKLGREVAIKTLPEEFAQDVERLARFEREAKLLASLNHPNIATIHGLEEDNGTRFLVLELVEGDTLADRLKRGAVAVEESLTLVLQIAEALEAAHEKGAIHRDLKPANIKVTPEGKIKVLDFGLAKAFMGDGSEVNLSQSPTLSMAATQQGVILGSAAYMSPEQARGQEVDKRADVWAFGVVLFEMLTGRGTFDGGTVSDVLAGVLAKEPQWNTLPLNLHPRIRLLLERCVVKDSTDRYRDIGDARVDIREVLADPSGVLPHPVESNHVPRSRRELLSVTTGVVITAIIFVVGFWIFGTIPPSPLVKRFIAVNLEDQTPFLFIHNILALSPDGQHLVYHSNNQLYHRAMDQMEGVAIPGTEDGRAPFFSPNGEWIAFFTSEQLLKVPLTGGTASLVADLGWEGNPGWWDSEGDIIFSRRGPFPRLYRVPSGGGNAEVLAELDGYFDVDWPVVLPGGEWVLFSGEPDEFDRKQDQIVAQSLSTGALKPLITTGARYARYARTGHLVYLQDGRLWAVGFDADRVEVSGTPVPVVENVVASTAGFGAAQFVIADDGSLVYVSATDVNYGSTPALIDRDDGTVEALGIPPARYQFPRVSPDGRHFLIKIREDEADVLWVYDLSGSAAPRRLTLEGSNEWGIWAPDGERITFTSESDEETRELYETRADGTGVPQLLASSGQRPGPWDWTRDGQFLLYTDATGGGDLWSLRAEDNETTPYYEATGIQFSGVFSPDGKWVAYQSNETGQHQIWVRPFPATDARFQITTDGGFGPLWSPDGKELFYVNEELELVSIAVNTDAGFSHSLPESLPVKGANLGRGRRS